MDALDPYLIHINSEWEDISQCFEEPSKQIPDRKSEHLSTKIKMTQVGLK